jgi:MFS family permease
MGFAASLAILPPLCRLLIDGVGWREAYVILGLLVLLLVVPAAFLFARDTPEQMGLHPDGYDHPPLNEPSPGSADTNGGDRRRVLTSWTFWILALSLTTSPFVVTALVFHQTGIFEERGVGAGVAAAVFVPYAIANAVSSAVSGVVVDRTGPKPVFVGAMALLLVSLGLSRLINGEPSAVVYASMLGTAGGLQRIVSSVIWAHYYGRQGLGRIQGSATSIMITMSALGPLPLAALEGATGSYDLGILLMAAMPVLSVLGVLLARTSVQYGRAEPAAAAGT